MNFAIKEFETTGYLSGDDLIFFYYDIGLDNLQGFPSLYDWDKNIAEFENVLDIKPCELKDMPDKVDKNCIRFTVSENPQCDNNNIAMAFFRHLRNAFSHYSITENKSFFHIIDNNGTNCTMLGIVQRDLLKQFCFRFFDQREDIYTYFKTI